MKSKPIATWISSRLTLMVLLLVPPLGAAGATTGTASISGSVSRLETGNMLQGAIVELALGDDLDHDSRHARVSRLVSSRTAEIYVPNQMISFGVSGHF